MRDAATFESNRPALLALSYRMLGELGRAEDVVQESWLRWQRSRTVVDDPKAFLLTLVTRLCLDELGSARARREESRRDRLPEPVDLKEAGIDRVEMMDRVSMAFLVVLQRLTPAERAVLLLHDVFDMSHQEIGVLLKKRDAACRQLLKRARKNVATERRVLRTTPAEHRRVLLEFIQVSRGGDPSEMLRMLADDAVLIADGGTHVRRFGRLRNIGRPVVGARRIVSVIKTFWQQSDSARVTFAERTLNGQPALVVFLDGAPLSAMLISVAGGKIRQVFFQGDPSRLRHVGTPH